MATRGSENKNRGPTVSDAIYSGKLARFMRENPDVAEWACQKFQTRQSREELEALMHIALAPLKQS